MRLENIINGPKFRFKQIMETLKKEFDIEIDFSDKQSLAELQQIAKDTAKKVKANESFNSQHQNPQIVCSYLVLEAIKLHKMANISENIEEKPAEVLEEGNEIDKAELLLASKNIVDDLQGMIEDISKMQVEKIPPIIERIKIEYGLGQAANYREQSMAALQSMMDSVQNAKDTVDNLTMALSGDIDMAQAGPMPMAAPEEKPDHMLDKLDREEEPKEPEMTNPEGRERKEESKKNSGKIVSEDLNLAAKTVRKLVKHDHMNFNNAVNRVKHSIVGRDEDMVSLRKKANELLSEDGNPEQKDAVIALLHKMMKADDHGDSPAAEEAYKELRILMNHIYPELYADPELMGEGEEAGQNMGEKLPPELKAWHVQVKSPATGKLFGNYRVWSPTAGIAKKTAQDAVMKKHGMDEWNDEYEFTIKPIKEDHKLDEVSRKHFRMTADTLKHIPDMAKRKELANHHAELYAKQNPRFNKQKFMSAAGIEENACGGATGAGAVASVPQPMFKKKKVISRTMESDINEATPPGMEKWVKDNKANFVREYGKKRGMDVLYATAWKMYDEKHNKKPGGKITELESVKESVDLAQYERLFNQLEMQVRREMKSDSKLTPDGAVDLVMSKHRNTVAKQVNPDIMQRELIRYFSKNEISNSDQTITAQQKKMPTMYKPVDDSMDGPTASPSHVLPKQPNAPVAMIKGARVKLGGKDVIVVADNGNTVSIKDTENGPSRMVAKAAFQAGKELSTESIAESIKMNPKQRAHRINRRALKKYDHNDFIDLVHANLGREHAQVADECLHGADYKDYDSKHLRAISDFAKKKGEHNLSYDIDRHVLDEVGAPTLTGTAPVHPDQAVINQGPPANLTGFNPGDKPYRLHVVTNSGKEGSKSFVNDLEAKKWLDRNGHHLKSVKVVI